jgi:uncharacterized protein with PQ loop repeat
LGTTSQQTSSIHKAFLCPALYPRQGFISLVVGCVELLPCSKMQASFDASGRCPHWTRFWSPALFEGLDMLQQFVQLMSTFSSVDMQNLLESTLAIVIPLSVWIFYAVLLAKLSIMFVPFRVRHSQRLPTCSLVYLFGRGHTMTSCWSPCCTLTVSLMQNRGPLIVPAC